MNDQDKPDPATQILFDKLNEIRPHLPGDSRELLRIVLDIAGDIERGNADSPQPSPPKAAATEPAAFEADFDAAFEPYPRSKADMMREYDNTAAPWVNMSIINALTSPPRIFRGETDG